MRPAGGERERIDQLGRVASIPLAPLALASLTCLLKTKLSVHVNSVDVVGEDQIVVDRIVPQGLRQRQGQLRHHGADAKSPAVRRNEEAVVADVRAAPREVGLDVEGSQNVATRCVSKDEDVVAEIIRLEALQGHLAVLGIADAREESPVENTKRTDN